MRHIASLDSLPRGARVSVYGAGGAGRALLAAIRAAGDPVDIRCVIDTYRDGVVDGVQVLRFQDWLRLPDRQGDTVVIASAFEDEIARQLADAGVEDFCAWVDAGRFILCSLVPGLLPAGERFTILDVGARDAAEDKRWLPIPRQRLRLYGFEADARECDRLNGLEYRDGLECRFFPTVLWGSKGIRTFHHSPTHPGSSSLFPFNLALFDRCKYQDRFHAYCEGERIGQVEEISLPVDTLDNWKREQATPRVDFAKLNVQGGELEVLAGGESVTAGTLGMLVEVAFVDSYLGRPFFSDVDPVLRARGFTMFDLQGPLHAGRMASPVTVSHLPGLTHGRGQLLEANALYFRDPMAMTDEELDRHGLDTVAVLKLAALAELFQQVEFAFEVLAWLAERLDRQGDPWMAEAVGGLSAEAVERYNRMFG